jgi:hypothetical protein
VLNIKWGVYEMGDEVHIAPCTEEGYLLYGHFCQQDCECQPYQDSEEKNVWVHRLCLYEVSPSFPLAPVSKLWN